jgi:hypothetical protein
MMVNPTVSRVNQSPVKKAVTIPENVPTNRNGIPNVIMMSNSLLYLSSRMIPSVLVSTIRIPIAVNSENSMISIRLLRV